MKTIIVILLCLIAFIYLLNPTAGIIELIPDNIPGIGNMDEGLATYIIISSIQYFRGKNIGLFGHRKQSA